MDRQNLKFLLILLVISYQIAKINARIIPISSNSKMEIKNSKTQIAEKQDGGFFGDDDEDSDDDEGPSMMQTMGKYAVNVGKIFTGMMKGDITKTVSGMTGIMLDVNSSFFGTDDDSSKTDLTNQDTIKKLISGGGDKESDDDDGDY